MSLVVKVLGRSRIEGGGFTTAGVAVNAKEKVWGQLSGTYEANGVAFEPLDLKLAGTTFDFLQLDPVRLNATDAEGIPTVTKATSVQYSEPDGKFICQTIADNGDRAVGDVKVYTINFEAFGDSAEAPALV
jgi:hypothetical protein